MAEIGYRESGNMKKDKRNTQAKIKGKVDRGQARI